jgi:hypothetical protein
VEPINESNTNSAAAASAAALQRELDLQPALVEELKRKAASPEGRKAGGARAPRATPRPPSTGEVTSRGGAVIRVLGAPGSREARTVHFDVFNPRLYGDGRISRVSVDLGRPDGFSRTLDMAEGETYQATHEYPWDDDESDEPGIYVGRVKNLDTGYWTPLFVVLPV